MTVFSPPVRDAQNGWKSGARGVWSLQELPLRESGTLRDSWEGTPPKGLEGREAGGWTREPSAGVAERIGLPPGHKSGSVDAEPGAGWVTLKKCAV